MNHEEDHDQPQINMESPVEHLSPSDGQEVDEPGDTHVDPIENFQEVLVALADLKLQAVALSNDFTSKLKYDKHKDAIIDNLHEDLQEYKNDLLLKLLQPLILDVAKCMDDISKQVRFYRDKDADALVASKILRDLEGFGGDLEDLLYRQGVDSFESLENTFDPKRQKMIKKIDTTDSSLHKTVAARVRKGFQWEGRVIRPERVDVYVYRQEESKIQGENNDEQ